MKNAEQRGYELAGMPESDVPILARVRYEYHRLKSHIPVKVAAYAEYALIVEGFPLDASDEWKREARAWFAKHLEKNWRVDTKQFGILVCDGERSFE